jgi:hypothetical protein
VEHEVRLSGSAAVGARIQLVSVQGFTGSLTVAGEERPDAAVEVTGAAFGADEADAARRAEAVRIRLEERDDRLEVGVEAPEAGRHPHLELHVRLPRRVGLRVGEVRGDVDVRGVSSTDMDTRAGDLRVMSVEGLVKGQHRGGQVEILRAGEVRYTIRMAESRIERIGGRVECDVTEGRLEVRDVAGALQLKSRRTDVEIDRLGADARIDATDNRVSLRDQRRAVTFEGRRARFSVALAGAAEVRATSEDEAVDVTLAEGVGAMLDLETENGQIRLPDESLTVERSEDRQRVRGTLGAGGATIVVRTVRGDANIRR